ncbi:GAF and ANTAR domain-containing protein [Phytoactinopolyspora mesophila]|uniref:ANTAR domain-containing protein n=1 Tax=Phytoactinopolyspora mesophila TaxID=2650750 RepID=A0A7K3M096_9ACTN|nr:GAF and ANTAR domain-containing protein [Phytoactinopolyspora mesophila]NDL55878.1 ANTAR domain-containing protein [Phytoactinopolyspora mesophila]
MNRYQFNRLLAEAARAMADEPGTQLTLERAVLMATDIIENCDLAGVSLVHRSGIDTHAASHKTLRQIDELQFELNEGPCLDALNQTDVLSVTNLAADPRWPNWGPRIAAELDIHSSMSFRLFTSGENLGALNLYATKIDAFSHEDLLDGLALAAHAAVALAGTIEEEQLHRALDTRRMIGEATGILRERFGLTTDQAWDVLRRISSQHNIKLHRVAQQLVDVGTLPDNA